MTRKSFAVVGDPISHSLSPKIHQAAYEYLNFDYSYRAVQVPSASLADYLSANRATYDGFSITMPLKFEAAAITNNEHLFGTGVANTLVRTEAGWSAYNTDIAGLSFALEGCFTSSPRKVAILGAGATSRSALVSLHNELIREVTVYARDIEKSANLVDLGKQLGIELKLLSLMEFGFDQDLTINTLPNGAAESLSRAGKQEGWLLSANYAGAEPSFTDLFVESKIVSGVEMLLGQAVEQIRLFTADDLDFTTLNRQGLLLAMRAAL
jgi:shikimate dehydrogenase